MLECMHSWPDHIVLDFNYKLISGDQYNLNNIMQPKKFTIGWIENFLFQVSSNLFANK